MEDQREQHSHHAPSQAYTGACPEDEINLLDLWRVLVRQWKVIGVIAGLFVLGVVAYVLLATPVYEVEAIVKQTERKYVEALNIPGISEISSADIFAKFASNLTRSSLRQQFVDENPQFFLLQGNVPKIKEGPKDGAEGLSFVSISLQGDDPKLVADWLNGFILLVERKTIGNFCDNIEMKVAKQKKEIENQLQIGRDFATQRRLDRITLLADQIAIARATKRFDRKLSGYSVVEGQRSGVPVDILEGPMYMRGVNELMAEKEALEKRKNDEPFIVGFRDKQEHLMQLDASLKQLQAARAIVNAVTVDQLAIQSKKHEGQRLLRVLALSVFVGGMIGCFAAFGVNFVQEQKAKIKD